MKLWPIGEVRRVERAFSPKSQRERALQAIGWNVIRFTGSEIFHNVNKCVDDLIRILQVG